MFSHKNIINLSLAFGIISWVLLLVFDILILFSTINKVDSGISPLIPHLIFDVFVVSLFLYYRYGTEKAESINLMEGVCNRAYCHRGVSADQTPIDDAFRK